MTWHVAFRAHLVGFSLQHALDRTCTVVVSIRSICDGLRKHVLVCMMSVANCCCLPHTAAAKSVQLCRFRQQQPKQQQCKQQPKPHPAQRQACKHKRGPQWWQFERNKRIWYFASSPPISFLACGWGGHGHGQHCIAHDIAWCVDRLAYRYLVIRGGLLPQLCLRTRDDVAD